MATAALDLEKRLDKRRKDRDLQNEPDDPAYNGRNDFIYQLFIMGCIYLLAFAVRLFSVIRYESIIHEFDPWFNFRVTKYLVKEGLYNFHNWFDDATWYPLGRFIGGTLYPGLMWTAALVYHTLNALRITVNIRNVCVLLAPFMASNTTVATYLLTKEIWTPAAGLIAAMLISICPGYISRSVAGSYDNEAVAIFALVLTFYLWVKAVKTGSMFWGGLSALGYFYMVSAWGGYIFIINLIPAHVLIVLLSGRYSNRLYVAYCSFFVLGTIMSMTISFVSFIPVTSPEHMPSIGIFGVLQLYNFFNYLRDRVPPQHLRVIIVSFLLLVVGLIGVIIMLSVLGYVPFLTGRLLSLLGSTSNIAIVKSVSEHQPSSWTTFFFDFHYLMFGVPVGVYYCFNKINDATIFIILYVMFASYFSAIMVRLVLVLSPAVCVAGAIATSETLRTYMNILTKEDAEDSAAAAAAPAAIEEDPETDPEETEDDNPNVRKRTALGKLAKPKPKSSPVTKAKAATTRASTATSGSSAAADAGFVSKVLAMAIIAGFLVIFYLYVVHCNWVTSNAYSSPSVILQARNGDGSVTIFDDFREAYSWLRHNTALDAKIMSWWDYGYQITGFGNRTVIVDNNTRNNSHIATVGLAMASTEELAYPILRMLDVDYVLVVFGGRIGYSSDDINKFLWMVRISGGIFPRIVEEDFFSRQGQYRVDSEASDVMKNCMMYKMCYYRFGETMAEFGQGGGFDRVRHAVIGKKDISFKYMEEAFTSEHWMVRIYRVLKNADLLGGVDYPRLKGRYTRLGSATKEKKKKK